MNTSIREKNAFTLIELILVIILISIVSFLAFSNFNFNSQKKYKINLNNIKEFMLKNFDYEKELSLTCIDDTDLNCYVFVDKNINKDITIENLFSQVPNVYNYDKDLSDYRFTRIRLDDIEYEPFFELKINIDKKHKNIVLDSLDEKVYLFSSISEDVKIFNTTNEIIDKFFSNEIEVKDAF